MVIYEAMVIGLLGLAVGSAINALVWRLHVGRSWVHGRSECPECGHTLAAKDLVPVLSWLALGGKCRYCRKPIQDSPWVELVTAVAFGVSVVALAPASAAGWLRLSLWLVLLAMLIILAVYDARWLILPDKVMGPLLATALVYTGVVAGVTHSSHVLLGAVEAAVVAGGAFFALVFFSRGRAMGGGDIKLAAAMGLILGLKATGIAMLVAFNTAAIVGVALVVAKKRGRRDQIAFGPFLVLGTVVAFWFAHWLVAWYLRANGLS